MPTPNEQCFEAINLAYAEIDEAQHWLKQMGVNPDKAFVAGDESEDGGERIYFHLMEAAWALTQAADDFDILKEGEQNHDRT